MGKNITKLFGIEKEERGVITTLLIQSVFLGIFYGVFNISAYSLFLAKFDVTVMAKAYILSGLVGIGLTYLYTLLQSKYKFTGFSVINLGFITSVTLALWILLKIYPENWVIFAIFILLGPLNLLALLGFYGTTGRLFTLRQGKRLFGIIDTGIVLGHIVSSFAIPALLSLNIQTHNIFLISSGSLFAALVIQFIISRKHSSTILAYSSKEVKSEGMSVFRSDSYIRTMGLFIALSVVVMFFVHYSFMAVARERYPEEEAMASFLGLFEGSMMVFTLLIKTFLFSYLIKNHGLKVTLAIGPLLIALFVLLATLLGFTKGYTAGAAGFMIFFLLLAISKLFSKALKDSVETPAFKVLYQTLSDKLRFRVQSAIDGTINEMAALLSGLLLTALGALVFIKLIHFSVFLLGVSILWIFIGLRLYNEYRNSVRKSLDATDMTGVGGDDSASEQSYFKSGITLLNSFYSFVEPDADKLRLSGENYMKTVISYSEKTSDTLMIPLVKKISEMEIPVTSIRAENELKRLETIIRNADLASSGDIITRLEEVKNKREVVNAYAGSGKQLLLTDLLRLIRDNDVEIKRQAIFIIGKQQVVEMIPELCDCLSITEVMRDAYAVIKSFGEKAFDSLNATFFRSSGNSEVRIMIIRLFGESGSPAAAEFLIPRLWAVHKLIRQEALSGLLKCKYTPDQETKDRLIQEVQDIIGLLTRYISSGVSLKENNDLYLAGALDYDSAWWHGFLFDLLALIYDRHSIDRIRENLEGGTVESVNFALEMLDIVVDDSIKPRLAALLDVVPASDKLKTLLQFYPGSVPVYEELVEDLVNLDYNNISVWTKSCAIRSLYNIDASTNTDLIIALLFSPNLILREEAVRYLRVKFRDVYDYCSYRIPESFREHLARVLKSDLNEGEEIYQRVLVLKEFFPEIQPDRLLGLAMRFEKLAGDGDISGSENIILFQRMGMDGSDNIIYVNWTLTSLNSISEGIDTQRDDLYTLPVETLAHYLFMNPDLEDIIVSTIDKYLN